MKRGDLHPGLAELLRADPDDLGAIGILADWLEEQGAVDEAEWLQDHLHGMAGVFRERNAPEPDLLGSIDPRWLGLRHGLIRTLRVPSGFERHAERTCRVLADLPLALGLIGANVPDGRSASAWMPPMAEWLPDLRSLQLGADVDPVHLQGFQKLHTLRWSSVATSWSSRVWVPALKELSLDVRGDSLGPLEALAPESVARLELISPSWSEVSHTPLVDFLERVPVQEVEMRGRGEFAFRKPLREAGFVLEEEADFGEPITIWGRRSAVEVGVGNEQG